MMAGITSGKLPLEAQQTEGTNPHTSLVECLPTLHHAWITEMNFLPYCPPNYLHETAADSAHVRPHQLDTVWVEGLEMMDSDLHWLLQQPYALFWCQVMFDSSLHKFLDSYLRYASRSFDSLTPLPAKVQETLRNIHRRVFMIFLRMSVNKESPSQEKFISPGAYGAIIYEHYLFDIPKLMDLCVLYGATNKALLSKMVSSVFDKQPQYHQDWKTTVEEMNKILDKILSEVSGGEHHTVRLDQTKTLSPSKFTDLVLYIADIAYSLCAFVEVFPQACNELLVAGFAERLVTFYEAVIPELQSQWHLLKKKVDDQYHIKLQFRQLKRNLTKLTHFVLQSCYQSSYELLPVTESKTSGNDRSRVVDDFITVVTTVLTEKAFLKEFEKHFSLVDTVKNMQLAHPELPGTHFDYVLSAMSSTPTSPVSDPLMTGATPQEITDSSIVAHIKELLPSYDEEFIQACLNEYSNDSERVVNHVLEMNLPPHLMKMASKNEKRETENQTKLDSTEQSQNETSESLVEQRSNIYDNDEFDVFRRKDVDLSRIHIGKKYDRDSASLVLDDKSVVDSVRDRYTPYEIETQWSYTSDDQLQVGGEEGVVTSGMLGMSSGVQFDLYNDEYDDTYDSHNVGAADNDSADELLSVQRLNPKGLYSRQYPEDSEEASETPSGPISSWPPDQRPPLTTMKQSEREQGNTATKHNKPVGEGGQGSKFKGHHHGDTGAGKQNSGNVRSRQMKERHKGSRANHNRKAGAEWKRNKGMGALR